MTRLANTPEAVGAEWADLLRLLPKYDPFASPGDSWFDAAAAERAIAFVEECIKHVEGDLAGRPFLLERWQKSILANLFGWQRKDALGRIVRRYRECLLYVARKNGKCLALDTPLPTPSGWVTMGQVRAGDTLFDETGRPCRVTGTSDIKHGLPCYRVSFSDGTSVVADAEHLWTTRPLRTGRPGAGAWKGVPRAEWSGLPEQQTFTTEQIRNTLSAVSKGSDKVEWNHRIAVCGPLATPDADLPIDPYTLGVWLGDGDSDCARLTIGDADASESLANLHRSGCAVGPRKGQGENSGRYRIGGVGLRGASGKASLNTKLRAAGLLGNKHIPADYLRASPLQRMALMQGLMDTDGYCSAAGQCEFTTTSEALRDGFLELARSLGYKPTLKTARATIYGRDCGPKYRVQFWAFADRPCFRLSRKAARLKPPPAKVARSGCRQIVAVDPVPSVPVRCVAVDSPSSLYLCGKGMTPTHNSPLCAAIALLVFFLDDERGQQDYIAAADTEQAGMLFRQAKGMVESEPELSRRCRIYGGNASAGQSRSIVREADASFLRVISADAEGKHGGNSHLVIVDELHTQPNRDLVDVLTTSTASLNRKQPLMLFITTADYARPSICNEKHAYATKVRDGIIDDPSFLPVVYEAGKEDDYRDPATWMKANPNLGVSVSAEYLERESKKASENPAYLNTFLRLHLNIQTDSAVAAIDMARWDLCGQLPWDEDDLRGQLCFGGLDLSTTTDLAALALLFPHEEDRYSLLVRCWAPSARARERSKTDRVPYEAWAREGWLTLTEGDVIDYDVIRRDVNALGEAHNIEEIGADPWNATQLTTQLIGDGFTVKAFRQGFTSMTSPTKKLLDLVTTCKLAHGGNPLLRWTASNLMLESDAADNKKPSKKKSTDRIDPMVAVIMALGLALVASLETTGGCEVW